MNKHYKIETFFHSQDDVDFMLKEMMNSVSEMTGADKATVQIFDNKKNALKLIDTIGFDHELTNRFVEKGDFSTCAAALKEHKQIFVDDLNKSSEFSEFNRVLAPFGLDSVVSTPLIDYNGKLLGVFTLYWNKSHRPMNDKLFEVDLYTQQAVQQLERNKAKHALAESEKKSGEPYFGTGKKMSLKTLPGQPAQERFIDIVCQPLHDSTGSVSGIFAQGIDKTKQTKARIELQNMNETLEKRVDERTESLLVYQDHLRSLAAKLSKTEEQERQRLAAELHNNLGQLLTLCKMNIDQLQKKEMTESEDAKLTELTNLMNEAITYTRRLMSDLKPPPAYKNEGFWSAIKWINSKMKKLGLDVQLEGDRRLKPYNEDIQTFLLQSIRELLHNVIKHAKVDKVRLVLTGNNNQMQIMVADQGMGFNVKETELVPYRESGFGLFNIKERMNLLGGSFRINSEPGIGTEVLLSVPQKPGINMGDGENKKTSARDESSEKNEPPSKIKVLLADDHRMMRKGLRKLIEEEDDMTVIGEASGGKEAVKLSNNLEPDIVVMDINMPGMDGIEATRQIISNGLSIRIIGLSFHKEEDVAKSMMDAGASVYLTKSDVFETLCETIRGEAGNNKK